MTEAVNAAGDMFGNERLHALIGEHRDTRRLFDLVWNAVEKFRQDQEQRDDISLFELRYDPGACGDAMAKGDARERTVDRQRAEFDFDAALLRSLDPQQLIGDMLRCFSALRARRTEIYTVITELFLNALDHGVLQLDSALKRNGAGFGDYYRERSRRLTTLEHGWIRVELEWASSAAAGELRIRVTDSGAGFDYRRIDAGLEPHDRLSRRGLRLAAGLCERLTHLGPGNIAEALYTWSNESGCGA